MWASSWSVIEMSFNHMKKYMTSNGLTMRQAKIIDGQRLMTDQFMKDPSYKDCFVKWQFGVEQEKLVPIPIKTFDEKLSNNYGITLSFNTYYDDNVMIGEMLYNTKSNTYWLCVESYDRDEIHGAGKLTRCNQFLKWQDSKGKIYEYPVYDTNATQYNSGVQSTQMVTIGSAQHSVWITADENTLMLDHDKRFFLDRNTVNPTVYKLTQNDTTTFSYDNGYLKLMMTEHQYNAETDSIENWICDYIEPSDNDFDIIYTGKPTVRIGGKKTFTADTEGEVTWSISDNNFDLNNLTVTVNGNKVTIACKYDESLFDDAVFELNAVVGQKESHLEIKLVGGV